MLNVSEKLILSDDVDDDLTQHIIGTHMDDLTQIYSSHITIRGSATFNNALLSSTSDNFFSQPIHDSKNVSMLSNNAIIQVDGIPFELLQVPHIFWMKSIDQVKAVYTLQLRVLYFIVLIKFFFAQNFGDINFSQEINVPRLSAFFLNKYPANNFFKLNAELHLSSKNQSLLSVILHDIKIEGNLNTNQNTSTMLHLLSSKAIRRLDNLNVDLPALAQFNSRLFIKDLQTNIDTNNFIRRSILSNVSTLNSDHGHLFEKHGRKHFTNKLVVKSKIIIENAASACIRIQEFNEYHELSDFFNSLSSFDRQRKFPGTIVFDSNLKSEHISVNNFIDNSQESNRSHDLNEILSGIFTLRKSIVRNLNVEGDAVFKPEIDNQQFNGVNVKLLNSVNVTGLLSSTIMKNPQLDGKLVDIHGEKMFKRDLTTQFVQISAYNEKNNTNDWMHNALRSQRQVRLAPQIVESANWTFSHLNADFLLCHDINGILITRSGNANKPNAIIINRHPYEAIHIHSDLAFSNILQVDREVGLNASETRPCNADIILSDVAHPAQLHWKALSLSAMLIISDKSNSSYKGTLSHVFQMAVLNNGNQKFADGASLKCSCSKTLSFSKVEVNYSNHSINGVNMFTIVNEAIMRNALILDQPIIIDGSKQFLMNNIVCEGPINLSSGDFTVNTINTISILEMNQTMVRNAFEIHINSGQKIFLAGILKSSNLNMLEGQTINGDIVENMVFVGFARLQQSGASVAFERMNNVGLSRLHAMENMNVVNLAEMSVNFFLQNRVKMSGSADDTHRTVKAQTVDGTLSFMHLVLAGNETNIEKINDVLCDDIVLKQSEQKQQIIGFKEIAGNLFLNKPCYTWQINNIEIVSGYTKTIFLDQNHTIEGLTVPNSFYVNVLGPTSLYQTFNDIDVIKTIFEHVGSIHNTYNSNHLDNPNIPYHILRHIDATNELKVVLNIAEPFDIANMESVRRTWFTIDRKIFTVEDSNGCPMQYHIEEMHPPYEELIIRRSLANQRLLLINFHEVLLVQVHTQFPPTANCSSSIPVQSIVYTNYKEILVLPNAIVESLHVFNIENNLYILLQIYGDGIVIYRQNTDLEWSEMGVIPLASQNSNTLRVIDWQKTIHLIVAERLHSIATDNNSESKLQLYRFDLARQTFIPFNEIVGNYDIVSIVETGPKRLYASDSNNDLYLVIGLKSAKLISFWRYDAITTDHKKQNFYFSHNIEAISTFKDNGRCLYMLLRLRTVFCL